MAAKKAIKPKFKTANDLRAACAAYFQSLGNDEPPTSSGLTLHLGFSSRRRLNEQTERRDGEDFAEVLDWCKEKIAHWHEKQVAEVVGFVWTAF